MKKKEKDVFGKIREVCVWEEMTWEKNAIKETTITVTPAPAKPLPRGKKK